MNKKALSILLAFTFGISAHLSAQAAPLTVFAAASLTDAFTELGQVFDAQTGNSTTFQFAGSQVLRTQLQQGAQADVYASANTAQYDPLVSAGLLHKGTFFVSNRLSIITPKTNNSIHRLTDLIKPNTKIVIADSTVPVGDYTRRMLASIDKSGTYSKDYSQRFMNNVVSQENNVRQVALKVQLGEADAAVVYSSDITPKLKSSVRTVALPSRFNQKASYPIGILQNSKQSKPAQDFLQFVLSNKGQSILRKWGFSGI